MLLRSLPTLRYSLSLLFLVILPALPADEAPNVALTGEALQSSTYNQLGRPGNAIDGSTAGVFGRGSCTHTDYESNPWWIVDLKAEYRVFHVSISNRGDCCANRLDGAEIRIGNSVERGGTLNARCATITSLGLGETESFYCESSQGQYVTVNQPNGGILTLCEVQVFGQKVDSTTEPEQSKFFRPQWELEHEEDTSGAPNVALEGKAFQSSIYNELGGPESAIDGSTASNYLRGHCTHTNLEINPWWTVDLAGVVQVVKVSITNRGDCCEERLNGAEIRIGNSPEKGGITNPRCATISSLGPGETGVYYCGGIQGQYVTVTIPGIRYLSLCEVQVFGVRVNSVAPNVALEGKAFQSSIYNELGGPESAIDGSTASNYLRGHCTHTNLEINPWWTVDLAGVVQVVKVSITNRGDCCEERLNGAEIRIGNSPEKGGITNPRCATISSLGPGETGVYYCGGIQGQYVTVTIPGIRYLSLCEVQVFGVRVNSVGDLKTGNRTETSATEEWMKPRDFSRPWGDMRGRQVYSSVYNVALDGKASQSSTYNDLGSPKNAIDGSKSADYLRGQCTHTQQETNPWWTVDLRATFHVLSVVITNRGDCCAERLEGAEIRVGDSDNEGGIRNTRCATITSLGAGETRKFECKEKFGRYVTVTIPGTAKYLSLCEVEVFGLRVISPVPNVALEGKAFQSSTFNKLGVAENAIDGTTSVYYMHGSCTHTDAERDPWWTVDLGEQYHVYNVSVTNREDCCEQRLNGAEIRIGNSVENGGATNPRCTTVTSLAAGETRTFDCEGMKGQYVTVTIPHYGILTVCEVEVYGLKADSSGDSEISHVKVEA